MARVRRREAAIRPIIVFEVANTSADAVRGSGIGKGCASTVVGGVRIVALSEAVLEAASGIRGAD